MTPPDISARRQQPRRLLHAVHGEPAVQGEPAAAGPGQGRALLDAGRPQGDRRHGRPVVRQCRPRPRGDQGGDRPAARGDGLRAVLPDGPSQVVRARGAPRRHAAGRPQPRLLLQLRLGGRRLRRSRSRSPITAPTARARAPASIGRERGYHGVGFGGISVGGMVNNRKWWGALLPGVDHLPHTHLPQNAFSKGQPEHGASSSPTRSRASSACTTRRTSPP